MPWNYRCYYRSSDKLFDIIEASKDGNMGVLKEHYDSYCAISNNRGAFPDDFPVWLDALQRVFAGRI